MNTSTGITNVDAVTGVRKQDFRPPAPQVYLPEPLWNELCALMKEHGRKATRQNKIISHETMDTRFESLTRSFRDLRGLGYKLESAYNLQQRHIHALALSWEERNLSSSTIANRISCLRALSIWIGKPGMIQKARDFVRDPNSVRRMQATTEDKSWSAKGIDLIPMINLVEQHDWRVGLQLKLMLAFGLRRKEAVMFRPLQADLGGAIRVRDGTKGGRERLIPLERREQLVLLEFAKSKVKTVNQHIGHPDRDLKQNIRRFYYVLEKFGITQRQLGVTSHGLRHEYSNDLYESIAGVPSPVRSKNVTADIDKLTHDLARSRVSQDAGHTRLGISAAYIGARKISVRSPDQKSDLQRYRELIGKAELTNSEKDELVNLVRISEPRA